MSSALELPCEIREVSFGDDRGYCRYARASQSRRPTLRETALLRQLIDPLLELPRCPILPLLKLHNLRLVFLQLLQTLLQLLMYLRRRSLYPLQPPADTRIAIQTPRESHKPMTHQIDRQRKRPRIRDRHHHPLQRLQIKAIIPYKIHQPQHPRRHHHSPIPPITLHAVQEPRPRLPIPAIRVLPQ